MMEPTEDPKDTQDTLVYNELRDHERHVRHGEFHPASCRHCQRELDMVRGGP